VLPVGPCAVDVQPQSRVEAAPLPLTRARFGPTLPGRASALLQIPEEVPTSMRCQAVRLLALASVTLMPSWVAAEPLCATTPSPAGACSAGPVLVVPTEVEPVPEGDVLAEASLVEATQAATYQPGWLPALAAVVPGALLHGSGVFAAGDRQAAYRLLGMQGAGVAALGSGIAILALSGASRKVAGPAISLTGLGAGLFFQSWMADFFAAALGPDRLGRPRAESDTVALRTGYRYVHDPVFAYTSFWTSRLDLHWGGWRLSPGAWVGLDDDHQRTALHVAYRWWGCTPGVACSDGSRLELEGGTVYHRHGREGFGFWGWEGSLRGRLDLERIAPVLAGAFIEGEWGWGMDFVYYQHADLGEDAIDRLLLGFAYGLYLGRPEAGHGEVAIYYDHRRESFAGGFAWAGVGSGSIGHVGLRGEWSFPPLGHGHRLGLGWDVQVGSAIVAGLDVVYRWLPGAAEVRP